MLCYTRGRKPLSLRFPVVVVVVVVVGFRVVGFCVDRGFIVVATVGTTVCTFLILSCGDERMGPLAVVAESRSNQSSVRYEEAEGWADQYYCRIDRHARLSG